MENPEQKFSLWLRSKLGGHVVRLENTIGAGTPDINWCTPEFGDIWIETKISHDGQVLLDKEQFAWGMRRAKCGGKVRVVCFEKVYYAGPSVFVYQFPLTVTKHRSTRFLRITSGSDHGVLKSEFHCGLLA